MSGPPSVPSPGCDLDQQTGRTSSAAVERELGHMVRRHPPGAWRKIGGIRTEEAVTRDDGATVKQRG